MIFLVILSMLFSASLFATGAWLWLRLAIKYQNLHNKEEALENALTREELNLREEARKEWG